MRIMRVMRGNRRKTAALLAALVLLLMCTPVGKAEASTVYHETFAGGKGIAVQSGGASLTHVTGKVFDGNGDGAALYVSNRKNNWDAADFEFSKLGLENGKTYSVTIKGYVDPDTVVPSGAQAWLQPVGSGYGWLAGADFRPGEAFTLSASYTVDESQHSKLRVQSNENGAAVPFYIGDILITGESSGTPPDNEVFHETFANGIETAVRSGGASLTHVTGKVFDGNGDGAALYISNRTNNWDAADFRFTTLNMENGKTYTITVKGYVDPDVPVTTGAGAALQTDKTYAWLAGANFEAGKPFTLTADYTVDNSTDTSIRIQSNESGKTVPFYVGDMLITSKSGQDGGSGGTRPPALDFETVTFEDQTAGGFAGRAGSETLTATDEANHTSGGAFSLKVEGRTATWHGPSLRVEKYIDQGKEYIITAWVKLIEPNSAQLQLSTQIGSGSAANYVNVHKQTISKDAGWVKFEGTYRYSNVSSEYITIYVESPSDATASFYIDDISFEPTGSGPIEIEKDLTPIKDVYKDYFLIGNAISAEDLEGVRLELLKMHHNAATAGNAMKPDALQREKGIFTFDEADRMVDKVISEGLKMHGHVLVWHQQSPAWMNTTTDGSGNTVPLEREEALANLRTHIKTVIEHFGNKVISWDVVNEAMNDNPPDPADWRASLRKTPWYDAVGDDYVEQAFLAAREVLDEHPDWDIKLYYNDYNMDNQNKSKAVYNMVKELNEKYAASHPGKLLIDGIGMQGHYMVSTNPANVELSLERFISLGVTVSITELDIQAGSNYQLSEKLAVAQGYLYAQLFRIFKAHAADIERVTFWGMDDGTSWRSSTNPTLFDKNLKAKPAYYGVIDPDKFISEHPPEIPADAGQSTAKYGTPVIDAIEDSVWNGTPEIPINRYQMAWQGASGKAKALWDDKNLYVLIQVNDTELDKKSANPWEQDSVEVFLDENNAKTSFYQEDDGQYRVNFDNETSFNPAGAAAGFESATTVSGARYAVEMKIPFKTITPSNNVKLGFDAQINDGRDGIRQSVATWNDTTGNGYQDTSVYGVLTLTGKGNADPGESSGGGETTGGGTYVPVTTVTKDGQASRAGVSVKVPVALNLDGTISATVAEELVDSIIQKIADLKKSESGQSVTLTLNLDAPFRGMAAKLPSNTFSRILASDPGISLEISTGWCGMKFDAKALGAISKSGTGEVEIAVARLDNNELAKKSPDAAKLIGDRPVYEFSVTRGDSKVADFGGGKATGGIAYAPAAGEDPDAIVAYWIDGNNNLNPLRSTCKDGVVEFETTHFSKFAVGYNKVIFNDLKTTDYCYAPATYLGARGVIEGGSFEPSRTITRGEAIVMIMKAFGIKPLTGSKSNFSDAAGEYAGYYAQAKAIGLSRGIGGNKIGADVVLTREMLFTLIYNMQSIAGELPETKAPVKKLESFGDCGKLSDWSVNAISKLVEIGAIEGINNTIMPKSACTRGETAAVLYRLLNRKSIG